MASAEPLAPFAAQGLFNGGRQLFGLDQLVNAASSTSIWMIVAGLLAIAIGAVLIWIGVEAAREYDRLPERAERSFDDDNEKKSSTKTTWLETAAILGIVFGALAMLNPVTLFTSFGLMNIFGLAMVIVAAIALAFIYQYKSGKMSKSDISIAKHSANMTIALGVLNYILFTGLPLLVGGSVLQAWSSSTRNKLPALRQPFQ
jgi:nitrogen fixation-related uncharacterized protein